VKGPLPVPPETDKLNFAACVSEAETPVKVTVWLVVDAFASAEKLTCCAVPGVRVMLVGEAETPVGRPLTWTLTSDEKPLIAVTDSDTEAELPPFTI